MTEDKRTPGEIEDDKEADEFAMQLLMPETFVRNAVKSYHEVSASNESYGKITVQNIHFSVNVSLFPSQMDESLSCCQSIKHRLFYLDKLICQLFQRQI